MSKLSTKLKRLGGVGPSPQPLDQPLGQAHGNLGGWSADLLEATGEDPAERLERLRQKIAQVVARSPAAIPPTPPTSQRQLPFVEQDTALGPLFSRQLPLEVHHRVGRFPVAAGREANPRLLSLLALSPELADIDIRRALYLDTETTGLSGGTGTLAFLVGLGWFSGAGAFVVEQMLLRRPGEEAPLLSHLLARIRDASAIVTFNGKSFDMPLLRTRCVMNRMPPIPPKPHIDLVHMARRVHKARIGACNLGSVESRVLGFERMDDVPSAEVAGRYFHFLRTADEGALLGVVKHNVWDIVSMAALVGLYGEPLDGMDPQDLAGVAATLHRARDAGNAAKIAAEFAEEAVARGAGAPALTVRASIAKARGDRNAALADLERLLAEVDDPNARLELAKLYEHHRRTFASALALVEQGVAEPQQAAEHRKARLRSKIVRQESRTHAKMPSRGGRTQDASHPRNKPEAEQLPLLGLPSGQRNS